MFLLFLLLLPLDLRDIAVARAPMSFSGSDLAMVQWFSLDVVVGFN